MRTALAAVFALFAVAASAQEPINADRPGIADGSQTVGPRVFQAELGGERDRFDHDREWSTPLLLRYGLSAPFELRVESEGYNSSSGWTPASIGFKYHFLDKPSLGIIARYFPPFRGQASSADLRLAADVDLSEQWSLNPNVGVSTQDDGNGRFAPALAALPLRYHVLR